MGKIFIRIEDVDSKAPCEVEEDEITLDLDEVTCSELITELRIHSLLIARRCEKFPLCIGCHSYGHYTIVNIRGTILVRNHRECLTSTLSELGIKNGDHIRLMSQGFCASL